MSIPIIGIDYDEPAEEDSDAPLNYRGVTLKMSPDGDRERFMSGHGATVDYLTAGFVAHYRLGPDAHVICSSSVDHYSMDGGEIETDDPTKADINAAVDVAKAYLIGRGEGPK